jgi:hypothetical protein
MGIRMSDAHDLPVPVAGKMLEVGIRHVPAVADFLRGTMDPEDRPLEVLPVAEYQRRMAAAEESKSPEAGWLDYA